MQLSNSRPLCLSVRNINKRYGSHHVLQDISFDVAKGEVAALLGPSGCGKTTILRSIAGFAEPDTGAVLIDGQDVTNRAVNERDFGIVFQDYALFPHLTVAENISYGLTHRRYRAKPIAARIEELLELVRMQDYRHRYPSYLSGGQQQRVALARALAPNPAVLLLDEPLSALDASVRGQIQSELRQLLRNVGITTVIVTHDHEEAAVLADQVVLMDRGRIVQQGSPLELYDYPNSRFAAEFMGDVNWLTAVVADKQPSGPLRIALQDKQLVDIAAERSAAIVAGATVDIGIRPERLMLHTGNQTGGNVIRGTVRSVVSNRTNIGLEVDLSDGTRVRAVHQRNGNAPRKGEDITLAFAPSDAFLLPLAG